MTPEAERIIARQLATGRYTSPDEVMSEAVRLLDTREQVKQDIRQKIEAGWQSVQAGRTSDGEAFMAELLAGLDDDSAV